MPGDSSHLRQVALEKVAFPTLFLPIFHFWLFSASHGSSPTPFDPGPLSLAPMSPYTMPRLYPMSFIIQSGPHTCNKREREREGSSLLSSLVHSFHIHSLNTCTAKTCGYKSKHTISSIKEVTFLVGILEETRDLTIPRHLSPSDDLDQEQKLLK